MSNSKFETVTDQIDTVDGANRIHKEKEAEAVTISNYVKVAKASLKMSMMMLQTQMNVLETLESQTDEEKLDMLFLLLDRDESGSIDAVELTNFIRKMNEGMTYSGAIDTAIEYVAANDDDLSGDLSKDEFQRYLNLVCAEVGSTFHEMCELILMNIFFSKNGNTADEEDHGKIASKQIKEVVREKAGFYIALKDGRMRTLFNEFDTNQTGNVDYQEAAIGLYKLIGDVKESALEAFDLLLMYDANEDRLMDYPEFVRLILHACALKGQEWSKIADACVYAIKTNPDPSAADLAKLGIAEESYEKAAALMEESHKAEEVMSVLHYQKFMKLYDILDSNDDGSLSFVELASGLRKYVKTVSNDDSLETSIVDAKGLLMEFDKDENQKLDRDEFALLLVEFAHMITHVDLMKLIDFLAVVALMDGDVMEEAYIQQISTNEEKKADDGIVYNDEEEVVSSTNVQIDGVDIHNVVYGKNLGTKENPFIWC